MHGDGHDTVPGHLAGASPGWAGGPERSWAAWSPAVIRWGRPVFCRRRSGCRGPRGAVGSLVAAWPSTAPGV